MSEQEKTRKRAELSSLESVENPPGIFRTTLSYDEQSMLCHFRLTKGVTIPVHNHEAIQHGYLIRGKLRFLLKEGKTFLATPGSSYIFESGEYHGAEVLEDSEAIDFFVPVRPEYADN
jgi:quercetin dioxygenase-like cupin family protein